MSRGLVSWVRSKNSVTVARRVSSSPTWGRYAGPPSARSSVVNPPRKTNTPSDVVGSSSAPAGVSCRKNPFWRLPDELSASVFCVTTARTTTCWPTSGDWNVAPEVVSVTGPCTSPMGRTPWTLTVSVQVADWAVPSSLVAVTVTA